jgi:hypothetical protein
MSKPSAILSRPPFFAKPEETEQILLPSTQPAVSVEDQALTLYAHFLAGKVQQQFSAVSLSGQRLRIEGSRAFEQLQMVSTPVKTANDDLQQLKARVSGSSLPPIPSFAERKKSVANDYHTQAVKCVGSKKILDFVAKDKRPKLLFVSNQGDDPNDPLSPSNPKTCKILRQLHSVYDVKFIALLKIQDLYAQLRTLPRNYLAGIVIIAHGKPHGLLRINWDGAFTDKEAADRLKSKSFIHLFSCLTGMLEDGPAFRLQNSLQEMGKDISISAPITLVRAIDIEFQSLQPLKVRYKIDYHFCKIFEDEFEFTCTEMPPLPSGFVDSTRSLSTSDKK